MKSLRQWPPPIALSIARRAGVCAMLGVALLLWARPWHVASAYNLCWNVCGARWYSHQTTWHDSTGWTGARQTAVLSAGPKWDAVQDTFTLSYDYSPTGPYQNNVSLYNLDSLGIYFPGNTWIYTAPGDAYDIVGGDTYLNSTWSWYTDGTMNQSAKLADVLTVTLHEIGHWMLLAHPCATQPGAVMCPSYVAKWDITQDDMLGMQALYY